jgi:hypothetical protein
MASIPFTVAGPTVRHAFPIGNAQSLVGSNVCLQSVSDAFGLNALGLVVSNGLAWTIDTR